MQKNYKVFTQTVFYEVESEEWSERLSLKEAKNKYDSLRKIYQDVFKYELQEDGVTWYEDGRYIMTLIVWVGPKGETK
jgi:hypothetical protein